MKKRIIVFDIDNTFLKIYLKMLKTDCNKKESMLMTNI